MRAAPAWDVSETVSSVTSQLTNPAGRGSKSLLHFSGRLRGGAIGSTPDFGSGYPGSSPGPGANHLNGLFEAVQRAAPRLFLSCPRFAGPR